MKEIKSLTSLRGLFALWVMMRHLASLAPVYGVGGWEFRKGYLGVDFFFLLSGFVLASAHGRRFQAAFRPRDYLRFVALRFGRLFPLHIAVTIACVLGATLLFGDPWPSLTAFVSEISLTQRWNLYSEPYHSINNPSWSISTEWAANLLFPVFVAVLLRPGRLWSVAFILCWALLAWGASTDDWLLDLSGVDSPWPLIKCFSEFALGMIVFCFRGQFAILRNDLSLALIVLGVVALLPFAHTDLAVVFLIFLGIGALSGDAGKIAKFLAVRPLHWLGEISYSVYLVHEPVLLLVRKAVRVIEPATPKLLIFGFGTLIGALLAATLTYHLIEVPARNWSKRTFNRSASRAARLPKPAAQPARCCAWASAGA